MVNKKIFLVVVFALVISISASIFFQMSWYNDVSNKKRVDFDRDVVASIIETFNVYYKKTMGVLKSDFINNESEVIRYEFKVDDTLVNSNVDIQKLISGSNPIDPMKFFTLPEITPGDKIFIDSLLQLNLNKHGINLKFKINYPEKNAKESVVNDDYNSVSVLHPLAGNINVLFEKKQKFLFQQIIGIILSSLFFIIIMVSSSAFLIWHYNKEQKILAFKNVFIDNLIHEIKTPLSITSLALERLESFNTDDNLNRYFLICKKENKKIKTLSERILKLSELDSAIPNYDTQTISVKNIIDSIISSFQFCLNEHDKIEVSLSPNDIAVAVNKTFFVDVVCNLIDNAIKYSVSPIKIQLNAHIQKDEFHLSVKDNGFGFDSKFKKKIFEPFFRINQNDTHNVKGHGIGLAYVDSIVKTMNGKIEASSILNNGSEFKIILPYES